MYRNKLKTLSKVIATCLCMATAMSTQAATDNSHFMKVLKKGTLTVGVKADTRPWGFRDRSGALVGMEVDMAKDIAVVLGVKLKLVPVQSSNRMQFLQQGKIDLMIATMSDKADRRRLVGAVDPTYYTSGTGAMSRKGTIKTWNDLKGKPVCGKQGAFYNKSVAKQYGAKIIAFVGNTEAKQALRNGKCVAWVYDDSVIAADLTSGDWNDFESVLPIENDTPWALAVPVAEIDGIWGHFMSGIIYRMHANGRLIELENKWGIKATSYLKNQSTKFKFDHKHLK